jgi:hypothetical protein
MTGPNKLTRYKNACKKLEADLEAKDKRIAELEAGDYDENAAWLKKAHYLTQPCKEAK